MQHLLFRIVVTIIALLCVIAISFFDYFAIFDEYNYIKFVIKIIPLLLLIIIPGMHMFKYKSTCYSFFMIIGLSLCLLGDIFLGIYDPKIDENAEENRLIYLPLGGGCFLIARMLFLLIFMIYPYDRMFFIRYNIKKMAISHILFNIPFVGIGFFFLIIDGYTIVSIMTFIYFILGFGFQLSYSFLRIKQLNYESVYSSIFGFLGMLFFNISDILLMLTILTNYIPSYCNIIADNIYWLSMFLLSISVVRYPKENYEKEILFEE